MDAATIQDKIYSGYAKAAARVGYAYDVYRCAGIGPAVADGNKIITGLLVAPDQQGNFLKPNKYGNSIWWSLHDGRQTQAMDILVGRGNVFFIASQQDLLPIQLVQCNRTVSVSRVAQNDGKGAVGYGGMNTDTNTPRTPVMTEWPCSMLEGSKGEKNDTGLPLDVKFPWYAVILPRLADIAIREGDFLTDEDGSDYLVHSVEASSNVEDGWQVDMGWRIKAQKVQA